MDNKPLLITILVIILAALGITGFAAVSSFNTTKKLTNTVNQIQNKQNEMEGKLGEIAGKIGEEESADNNDGTNPEKPKNEDETKDWKTYTYAGTSTEKGFEVKYPSDLTVDTPYGLRDIRFEKNSEIYYSVIVSELSGKTVIDGKDVNIIDLTLKQQLAEYLTQRCKESNINDVEWKSVKIDGLDGLQAFSSKDKCLSQYLPWSIANKNNLQYGIKFTKGSVDDYNNIVSSFKFIK